MTSNGKFVQVEPLASRSLVPESTSHSPRAPDHSRPVARNEVPTKGLLVTSMMKIELRPLRRNPSDAPIIPALKRSSCHHHHGRGQSRRNLHLQDRV